MNSGLDYEAKIVDSPRGLDVGSVMSFVLGYSKPTEDWDKFSSPETTAIEEYFRL